MLDMWQGAEQEFASGPQPVGLFQALEGRGLFSYRPIDNTPKAHLRNGGVCYIHSNLFEVCTPECHNPVQIVAYDKANEAYARLASWAYEEQTGRRIHLYKANIALDPKGNVEYTTLGAHENYLVKREGYIDGAHLLVPFMILRQLFCGTGGYVRGSYMISPRTIFPLKVFSEMSSDYPIISLRDESHAEAEYSRAHIVFGEGARSEYTIFIKHSITSYVLRSIQEGFIKNIPELSYPIEAGQELSRNLNGDWNVEVKDGKKLGALDYLNSYYLEGIERLFDQEEPRDHDIKALSEFKWLLGKLENGLIEDLDTSVEWIIKLTLIEKNLLENFQLEKGIEERTAKETTSFQYTAVTDPLYDKLVETHGLKRVVSDEDIEDAFMNPPVGSRGSLRVALAKYFEGSLETLGWSYMKIKKGEKSKNFIFENLDGWNEEEISRKVNEIMSKINK